MKTLVENVASWVAALRYEELSAEVIEKAKRILLDTLGCALGALDAAPVCIARQVASLQGGNPQSTLIGMGGRTSCDNAAFLNGMALRYLDYNDYVLYGRPLHPSINVAPALAVAEMQGLTGKDLLLAIITGYEVELRLRDAAEKDPRDGWDYCSTTAHYSAAATAAKLFGLDATQISHALAIAGSHASTLGEIRNGELSMWKGAAEPMAARNGTFAALLARSGMTGPTTILEGKFGYGEMVSGVLEEEILRNRSGDFHIMKSCMKVWPCVVTAQAPIAAALEIRRNNFVSEQIESITVALSDFGYRQQQRFLRREIRVRETADHSVAYAVVRALLAGEVKLEHFNERSFREPRALALLDVVSLRSDSGLTALYPKSLGAQIELRLRNGNVLRAEVLDPTDHKKKLAGDESVTKKFLALAEDVLGKHRAQRAIDVILSIDKNSDLTVLLEATRRG